MHVLYLLQSPVSPRPIVTLLEYFIDSGRARSLSWQRETARAVGLLVLYITHCRSRCSLHPFLFVSQKVGFESDPYTVDSYRQAHARAVGRIGLVSSRSTGTTPHGHRHAYGQRLADAEVDELIIQRVMHHKSPSSQGVYTEAPAAKIEEALATAERRLAGIKHESIYIHQLLGWK
jgi:integrase